ncbi:GNAT family N-acetyltransferase [Roseinatronobacter alkalisoli]|uniref:L-ornithine N(alpha)-acyltransferase n=1 Tax=Roseinatronobacter alkalisoli TaxID=3028235 RepID=A0ABT5T8S6_9RHOB|nr:GNAT family N-acyltransferase [Roseinatronobacter sp. HJB301]MDD7971484.1 GNAT family N-acetyltransferase [Roseinatronobacter sp. HJB301]
MTITHFPARELTAFPADLVAGGLVIGGFPVRIAQSTADLQQVHALRRARFLPDGQAKSDRDRFDSLCVHLMVSDPDGAQLLATARLRLVTQGAAFPDTYTAQFYDLSAVARHYARALEIGRLCQVEHADNMPDALRALLAGVTLVVLHANVDLMFGCTSFRGQDVARHRLALAWLKANHLGPAALLPGSIHPRASNLPDEIVDPQAARQALPALLRMYLGMGGWVSDLAITDPELDTVHVFTAVATAAIPLARLRALRALCPV